jgi:peptide/nickel transport system ATP-binding protein
VAHLLEVNNLKTEFIVDRGNLQAVNGVSYYLDEGEIVAFVGESGSGKSVTQYSSLQLIPMPPGRITGGEILFEGQDLLQFSPTSGELRSVRGGKIGVVFQEPMTSLNPVMTVGNQLTEGIILHMGMNRSDARKYAAELLTKVGISDAESRLNSYPHQFSGGMRQRIMIAIALSCNPKLLIADEATSALDVTTQAQILELMKDLVVQTNTTLVIVTHNLSVVARYADRVYVMYGGEIMESGTTLEIFQNPRHPYTISLLKAVPSITTPKDRKLIPIDGIVADLVNRKDQCIFVNRCPFAAEVCLTSPSPQLHAVEQEPDHAIACYREITRDSRPTRISFETSREVKPIDRGQLGGPILKVDNLKVYFPVRGGIFRRKIGDIKAVDDVSFEVYRGETFGLVGESGCGKSTVARTITRLIEPTAGQIYFNQQDITNLNYREMRPLRRNMSMIFQDPYGSLDPRQQAGKIVMEPMKNFDLNLSKEEMDQRVDELFQMVGLDPVYRRRVPHEFSGGQRQRLAIARALSTDPSFIVCDEAISALDVSIQAQVINLLDDLQRELNLTYMFIAHDLSVVRHISDRIAVMYLGKIMEVSDWASLYDNPKHPYTQALLEAIPVPDPVIEAQRQRQIIEGEVPSMLNSPTGCPFSPRCPLVTEECRMSNPTLEQKEPGHWAACFNV